MRWSMPNCVSVCIRQVFAVEKTRHFGGHVFGFQRLFLLAAINFL